MDGLRKTNSQQITNRKLLWDEENHLLASNDNGFVTSYWYDAAGERTVKETGDGEGVNINGAVSAVRTGTSNYTVYVNPYTVINNGGQMSKHIYLGGERILSKLCDAGSMPDPTKDTTACAKSYSAKYADLTGKVKTRFDSLGVSYFGKDNRTNNTYYVAKTPPSGGWGADLYYFHSDHLGSASLITDGSGHLNQNLAYIPYGEVFVNQCATSFDSRYKFSGKEMDAETGLYYFSQRYMDPKNPGFISVDPLAETTPNVGSYVYCHGNPLNFIDILGLYDDKASAQQSQKDATMRYGVDRVGDIYNSGTDDNPNYKFQIFTPGKDKYSHGVDGGVMAYKPEICIENDNQYYDYKTPKLSQRNPTLMERWSHSENFFAKLSYNSLNNIYVFAQGFDFGILDREEWTNPFTGASFGNLDGSPNYNQEDALISVLPSLMSSGISQLETTSASTLGSMNKMNASQFSKTFKGNLSRLKPSMRGKTTKMINYLINKNNGNLRTGSYVTSGVIYSGKKLGNKQNR